MSEEKLLNCMALSVLETDIRSEKAIGELAKPSTLLIKAINDGFHSLLEGHIKRQKDQDRLVGVTKDIKLATLATLYGWP